MSQQTEQGYEKNCEPPRMENDKEKNEENGKYDPLPRSIFCHLRRSFCTTLVFTLALCLKVQSSPLSS
jgi:hypothetical protein